MNKDGAQLIAANGVLIDDARTITESFDDQAQMNPRLGKMVGHISLNFSAQDKDKTDNTFMRQITSEYMQKMGITDTQYILVRHNDREHPHCHIVFNRVSNSGKTISDQNDRLHSVTACREITKRHGLYLKETDAKQDVKREQLRGPAKVKYEIHDAIRAALPLCSNWNDLQKRLVKAEISITYKFKGSTDQKEGVIFSKDGQSFNGSKVDRQYSFSKLDAALNENARRLHAKAAPELSGPSARINEKPSVGYSWPDENSHSKGHSTAGGIGGLFDFTPGPVYDENEAELLRKKRKKKKAQRKMR